MDHVLQEPFAQGIFGKCAIPVNVARPRVTRELLYPSSRVWILGGLISITMENYSDSDSSSESECESSQGSVLQGLTVMRMKVRQARVSSQNSAKICDEYESAPWKPQKLSLQGSIAHCSARSIGIADIKKLEPGLPESKPMKSSPGPDLHTYSAVLIYTNPT